jgi:hypothetical protein
MHFIAHIRGRELGRYKGLERPAVIVTDLKHEVEQYNIRMNIAVSRAFGVLRVVVAYSGPIRPPILVQNGHFLVGARIFEKRSGAG